MVQAIKVIAEDQDGCFYYQVVSLLGECDLDHHRTKYSRLW